MNTVTAARLVAAREIRVKLRDKAFLMGTAFFLLFTVGGLVVPALLNGPSTVAVADASTADRLAKAGLEVKQVPDGQAAERLVRDGDVDAAVVAGPRVLAMDEAPTDVLAALSTPPPVHLLDPSNVDPVALFVVPFALGLIYYISGVASGVQIAQSVTEEKQTRIVEILVASVPVRALLAGKVIGGAVLAVGQIVLLVVAAVVGLRIAGLEGILTPLLPALGWFLPFYLVGFAMLAALWAAVGALVSRQEDIGSAATPMTFAVMIPFLLVTFLKGNAGAMAVLSYVPLSAPIAMPVRLFLGGVGWWEPLLSFAVLLATAAALIAVGARLYTGSLLRTNGKTSWATAWRSRSV